MAYMNGEDYTYYDNCNTYYDSNYNQNIPYGPTTYYPPEYSVYPPTNPDIYQYNGVTYLNEQYYDPRGVQPFETRGYQNYSEDELISSDFMNQGKPKGMNHLYPTVVSNGFADGGNIPLHNEINGRTGYRSGSSRRSNRSSSVISSVNPKNNEFVIHINGNKAQKGPQIIGSNYGREESVRSWVPISTNRDRITEDNGSYLNEHENEEADYSGGYQQHFETTENGRTTIISINCNNMKNTNPSENSNSDNDDSDEENEASTKQKKKPAKPKKLFMGKYLFSDIKKSVIYPLSTCASNPTMAAPNSGCFQYKLNPKSRGGKDRKPEIVVRY